MRIILQVIVFLTIFTNYIFAQSEPLNQATNLSFLGIKAYGLSFSFTPSDASHYLVLRSTQAITATPVDGVVYRVGDRIGNAKVKANGTNSFYSIRESIANTTYYFAIYAYNDGSTPNYLDNSPLLGNQTTLGKTPGNYYTNYRIDTEDAIDDMSELLLNHSHLDYGNFDETVIKNIYERDTANGEHYVQCEYSNQREVYTGTFTWSGTTYNREHVTPRAWMPSDPSGTGSVEASDYINLFSTLGIVNQQRSNNAFGEVQNTSGTQYFDSKNGQDADGMNVFEPQQNIKGNIARTLFYEIITYNGKSGSWAFNNLQTFGSSQNVDLLVQWHLQDPVDNFEIARNEYIYSIQNNRNPFIDNPTWVSCIDFKTLTLNGTCPLDTATNIPDAILSLNDNKVLKVFPNPINDIGFVKLNTDESIISISLENTNGQTIALSYEIHDAIADFNLSNISGGIYFLKIETKDTIYIKKVNKQ